MAQLLGPKSCMAKTHAAAIRLVHAKPKKSIPTNLNTVRLAPWDTAYGPQTWPCLEKRRLHRNETTARGPSSGAPVAALRLYVSCPVWKERKPVENCDGCAYRGDYRRDSEGRLTAVRCEYRSHPSKYAPGSVVLRKVETQRQPRAGSQARCSVSPAQPAALAARNQTTSRPIGRSTQRPYYSLAQRRPVEEFCSEASPPSGKRRMTMSRSLPVSINSRNGAQASSSMA